MEMTVRAAITPFDGFEGGMSKKILVIEDEILLRESILELLDLENFQALGAEDGSLGLELAREQQPDLIICDIAMPGMDGYSVLTALRSDPVTAAIPFIFLTAKTGQESIQYAYSLGATDYMIKPFSVVSLLKTIQMHLKQ